MKIRLKSTTFKPATSDGKGGARLMLPTAMSMMSATAMASSIEVWQALQKQTSDGLLAYRKSVKPNHPEPSTPEQRPG